MVHVVVTVLAVAVTAEFAVRKAITVELQALRLGAVAGLFRPDCRPPTMETSNVIYVKLK